jgi:hypothetical protein
LILLKLKKAVLMSEILSIRNANMEIASHPLLQKKKMDTDEKAVRKALVAVWTLVLERYARPGVPMPSPEALRHELLRVGVDAGVEAVLANHWVVFDWMVRPEIEAKIREGLELRFLAEDFIKRVEEAQNNPENPALLAWLRAEIRRYVMEDL